MSFRQGASKNQRSGVHVMQYPTKVGELLPTLLKKSGVRSEVKDHRIVVFWAEIVGRLIASRAWPDGFTQGVLWIRVKNSVWMNELAFLRGEVMSKVNQYMGEDVVTEVKLHLGSRPKTAQDDQIASTRPLHRPVQEFRDPPRYPPSAERLAEIRAQTDAMTDTELGELIFSLRRRWNL